MTEDLKPLEITPQQALDPVIRRLLERIHKRLERLAGGAGQPHPEWGPCTRCGYVWKGHISKHPPMNCARCHSRVWQLEPSRPSARLPEHSPNPNWTSPESRPQVRAAKKQRITLLPPPPRADEIPVSPRPLAEYLAVVRRDELQPERMIVVAAEAYEHPDGSPRVRNFDPVSVDQMEDSPGTDDAVERADADLEIEAGEKSDLDKAELIALRILQEGTRGLLK